MNKVNERGFIAGFLVWLILAGIAISNMACTEHGCGRGDLILFVIVLIAMMGPAYLAALLFSSD